MIKLGKLAPKRSLKTPALGSFLHLAAVPTPPEKTYREFKVKTWHMMKNDTVGDCTCAGAAHMIMNWSAHTAVLNTPTDDEVIAAYSDITGYDGTDATDNGAAELDVLNYWRATGIAGHKIAGYATLDVQNIQQIKAACYLFGGVYIGFQVPQSIAQNPDNHVWNQIGGSIEGGHAVPVFGYGSAGCTVVSWGDLYQMSWGFWQEYVDEAYAVLSADWLDNSGVSPVGLDLPALLSTLQSL